MGFKPVRKRYRLTFTDAAFEGFEVIMRSLSTGEFLEVTRQMVGLRALDSVPTAGDIDKAGSVVSIMGRSLVSWNLEDDDDRPVPCSEQAISDLDLVMMLAILEAWTTAMASVPRPLPGTSNGGGRFPELSIPMETLSPNRTS